MNKHIFTILFAFVGITSNTMEEGMWELIVSGRLPTEKKNVIVYNLVIQNDTDIAIHFMTQPHGQEQFILWGVVEPGENEIFKLGKVMFLSPLGATPFIIMQTSDGQPLGFFSIL